MEKIHKIHFPRKKRNVFLIRRTEIYPESNENQATLRFFRKSIDIE